VTIVILWFAGASAMAGLLNLVPRYLPRYGMAPDWARATRPLVLLITAIGFIVTILFKANVNLQGGAYATGVLVLMTSAAVAVTLAIPDKRKRFLLITTIFLYTTVVNIIERPEGIKIAAWFIVTIIGSSLISRVLRSTEIRIEGVRYDETATRFVKEAAGRKSVRIIASRPNTGEPAEYARSSVTQNDRITCPTTWSCSSRSARETRPISPTISMCTVSTSAASGCSAVRVRRFPTRSRACCWICAIGPGPFLTRTLGGPRGIRSRTCSSSWRSARATQRRCAGKCCARPSPIPSGGRGYMLGSGH